MGKEIDTVTLVPYKTDYLQPFLAWRLQDATRRYNPLRSLSLEELGLMLAGEGSDLSDLGAFSTYRWFVLLEDQVVGSVCVKEISHAMGYAEIGYGLDAAWHGQGIGTAAVRTLVDKVFGETALRKLLAFVHSDNISSCKLLERIGFKREGLLREHYLIDGSPVDEAVYGLLRRDLVHASAALPL